MLSPPTYKPSVLKVPPDAAPISAVGLQPPAIAGKEPTPHASDQAGLSDRPVWVAEYGHGARKGKVIARDGNKAHIRFDPAEQMPDRWVFAKSVFDNAHDAQEASV